ncbi:MAG: hypothetical protein GYA14_16200 [Ignavibacteria bacterium]|nr:hypothetical protein [Ignavibacteria bacterium]
MDFTTWLIKDVIVRGDKMKKVIGGLWLVIGIILIISTTQIVKGTSIYPDETKKTQVDTTVASLKTKYEAELKNLKIMFEQIYLQIAYGDPQVSQRMQQLLEGNSKAVSLITTIQLYEKLIKELTPADERENKKENKKNK